MSESYTYVDRFDAGIAVTDSQDGAVLLTVYSPGHRHDWLAVEIRATERAKLAAAIQLGGAS